jgi:hypothetical protein
MVYLNKLYTLNVTQLEFLYDRMSPSGATSFLLIFAIWLVFTSRQTEGR